MSDLRFIQLVFVKGPGFASGLIEYEGHGRFSHVASRFDDGRIFDARSDTVGGAPPGVHFRDPAYLFGEITVPVDLPCTQDQYTAYWAFLRSCEGQGYDKWGIVGIATNTGIYDPAKKYCSELVQLGLQPNASGWFPHPLYIPAHLSDPNGLLNAISARMQVTIPG